MPARTRRRLAAILAADIVGYSRLMCEDEAGTLQAVRSHREELIAPRIAAHEGRIVKLMGDGLLAEFHSAVEAVRCAVAIQRTISERNGASPENRRIVYRMGINVGDVIVEEDDIFGDGVNVAARIEQLADPGEIYISQAVYAQVSGKVDRPLEDLGKHHCKNIADPVRIYRVALDAAATRPLRPDGEIPQNDRPSIAVLPFVNMSGEPEQCFFSDGIAEDIITDLARLSGLFVIARNSAFAYRDKVVDIRRIGDDLGARYLLEGSVRKSGNRVRITAQLVDAASGGHVWADRYDRDLTNIFQVQDEITKNIVEALRVAIAPREKRNIERTPTSNIDAYEFYLRGRQFLHAMTRKTLHLARRMFSAAIELDPGYAQAYAGLADCGSVLYLYYAAERDVLDEIMTASRKALQLDPDLAEAHVSHAVALSLSGDQDRAEKAFDTAVHLDPMLYEAYWFFGIIHVMRGDFERSALLFEKASQVRGEDLQSMMMLNESYRGLGRLADARTTAERTVRIAEKRLAVSPDDARAAYVGAMALVTLDDLPRAREWVDLAAAVESEDPRTTYNLACAYALLDEADRALDFLELSIDAGRAGAMIGWAKRDPDLDRIRDTPRFEALIRRWQQAVGNSPGPD